MDRREYYNPNWERVTKFFWAFELSLEQKEVLPKWDCGVGRKRGSDILKRKTRTGKSPKGQKLHRRLREQ